MAHWEDNFLPGLFNILKLLTVTKPSDGTKPDQTHCLF
jgi:hypothetical protein